MRLQGWGGAVTGEGGGRLAGRFWRRPLLLMVQVFLLAHSSVWAARPDAPADFSLLDATVTTAPDRFGVNLHVPHFNNWTIDPGMEPTVMRLPGVATGGGTNYVINDARATTSYYDTIGDGFFDGATIRIYRVVNGVVEPVTTGTVTGYYASAANGYRIDFSPPGPAVQADDWYVLDMISTNAPMDKVHPRMSYLSGSDTWRAIGGAGWPYGLPVEKWRDDTTQAPEDGGLSSMTFTTTGTHEVSLRQYYYGAPGSYYPTLVPGRTYRMECWLKQSGVPSGQVSFRLTGPYASVQHTWNGIDSSWSKRTFDFVAPPHPPSNTGTIENVLAFVGPGQVWVDNLRVFDPSYPVYDPWPEAMAELDQYRPGVLRIWTAQTNVNWGTTLDDCLTSDAVRLVQWHPDNGRVESHDAWKLPLALETCRRTGAEPWLIVGPYFTEEEWRGLMEYLAGPAGTKYGDLRISHGQVEPWTEVFPRILIEFNNEGWNAIFTWQFPTGTRNGQFAEYFFNAAQSSPWFAGAADRIKFMVNGWIVQGDATGFGPAGILAGTADFTNVATYIGGWEAGGNAGGEVFSLAGLQDFLLYPASNLRHYFNRHATTRAQLAAGGRRYQDAVYEGGPGYPLPMPGQVSDPVAEAYGKSLAAGVATLDCFLDATIRGFGPQAFFSFRPGPNWSTHSEITDGYLPHSTWLALQMRNRWAAGDATAVAVHSAPTADVPAQPNGVAAAPETPLVACYGYRDGADWSAIVLSRRAQGDTSVTLRLPFSAATTVTLHRLTGDPTTSNTLSENLSIDSTPVVATLPAHTFVLPPASVYLFHFQGTSGNLAGPPPATLISRALGQNRETTEPQVRFGIAFTRPVAGLDVSDLQIGGTAAPLEVSLRELEPFTGVNWEAAVSGMSTTGTVTLAIPGGAVVDRDGGYPNQASVEIDDGIFWTPAQPRNAVLVYDGFEIAPQSSPAPPFIHGVTTGHGWAASWQTQNFSAGYVDGYKLENHLPLTWPALSNSGSYLTGGRAYEGVGRQLDVEGALAEFRQGATSPALVGRSGTELWTSVLIRKAAANDDPVYLSLGAAAVPWMESETRAAVGYFGSASNLNGQRYWSLLVRNAANTGFDVIRTEIPVVPGETVFLVLRTRFGTTDELNLIVNPTLTVSPDPPPFNVTWTTAPQSPDIVFRNVGFRGGNSLNQGSIDEFRMGDSWLAVILTPSIPVTLSAFTVD